MNISESDSWTRKLSDDEGKIIGKWIYKSVRVIKDLPLGALLLLKLQYRTGKNAIKLSINSNKPGFGFYCLFHAKLAAQPYQGLTHSKGNDEKWPIFPSKIGLFWYQEAEKVMEIYMFDLVGVSVQLWSSRICSRLNMFIHNMMGKSKQSNSQRWIRFQIRTK